MFDSLLQLQGSPYATLKIDIPRSAVMLDKAERVRELITELTSDETISDDEFVRTVQRIMSAHAVLSDEMLHHTYNGSFRSLQVAEVIIRRFRDETGVDLREDKHSTHRIIEASEMAARQLFRDPKKAAIINIPFITAKDGLPIHISDYEITEADL